MSYICLHCGHHFDSPTNRYNQAVRQYDNDGFCPNCGSEDFEEAVHCMICGEDFAEDQVIGNICKNCLDKSMTFDNAMKYGEDRKTAVELNGFLAYAFSASEIAEILTNVLKLENKAGFKDAKEYCDDDRYDFENWLEDHHDAE